jgi:phage terminase large subunit-like protein
VPVSERVDALDLMAALVLEDGSRWGEKAAPFQWADATAVLDVESATPYHFLTRSRGGSKTADLAGMAVAAMLTQLPAGSRLYALAADRDQGRLLLDSVQGYRERTPMLRNALEVGAYRVTATRGGSTLDVLAADAPGAWGLRPAFLIVDELAQWPATSAARRLWEAGMTAMHKVPGSRLAVLTSAGDPAHWSYKLLEHARPDRLWRVHEVDGPPPWTEEERLEEQRRQLPESSFRQRYLNEWVEAEDRLTSRDDLAACVTLDGPLPVQNGKSYVIGLDIGLKHDRTVAAVCHLDLESHDWVDYDRATGWHQHSTPLGATVVLDRMQVWQGRPGSPVELREVEEWLAEASRTYRGARVVYDPFQAVGSMQRLRTRGVQCDEFTFSSSSVGRLASTLHLLLRNRRLSLPDDPELLEELGNVRLRETSPGVLRMDHDPDKHDDRAIALALAAHRLLERAPSGEVSAAGPPVWV